MRVQALHAGSACKSWALVCDDAREAVVVDVVLNRAPAVAAAMAQLGLRVTRAIDTHTHADHVSGGTWLRKNLGCGYSMHQATGVVTVSDRLKDGDGVLVGRSRLSVMHLPGHTKDSLGLWGDGVFLTGDFLFLGEGGAGRTDLLGGDPGEHWDSLQRLKDLQDDLVVLPGHDYRGAERGRLGDERRTNPRLTPRSRTEYVAWLSSLKLEPADWMLDVLKANARGATDESGLAIPMGGACCEVGGGAPSGGGSIPSVKPATLAARLSEPPGSGFHVLDVREPMEFVGPLGHVPGATNLSVQELPQRWQELGGLRSLDLYVICLSGARSARAVAMLLEKGFSKIWNVEGGTRAWAMANLPREYGEATTSSLPKDGQP
jgi:glyoxylase-like metal-dependent hydrolase (beta-lactamase superfamily II)/rhodanese-related sulfurtransferase